jgi:hypothetical protein
LPSALAPALIAALAGAVAAKLLTETATSTTSWHTASGRPARPETKTALPALAVATALSCWLGLTRQARLPETAARTEALFAPLLAHRTGDARQMGIGRGGLPFVIVQIHPL